MVDFIEAGSEHASFLFELYASTRGDDFTPLGLPKGELAALLRMQYEAQRSFYDSNYADAEHRVITHEGEPIGRMLVSREEEWLVLVDIALLPAFRRRGIGGMLLKRLQTDASKHGLGIQLHVRVGNPARSLYERYGFEAAPEQHSSPFTVMKWKAGESTGMSV
ncbi:GNAT family N-acetyltransferase [Paenibacillus sp. YYML68]|uniref:GNAT family N-acetyltransferase n=1 Tax=Paenibacillus sp. YYML68 TaxID=2909250 RepID=UPI0024903F02|nr:GNAT family N-acetyltransferase [Paenibacillus sp. YYML68]